MHKKLGDNQVNEEGIQTRSYLKLHLHSAIYTDLEVELFELWRFQKYVDNSLESNNNWSPLNLNEIFI